jgi:hypothetical protein
MYLIDWEEITTVFSSDSSEMMLEMNYLCEDIYSFARYSNPYIYNYEEYDYTLLRYVYHD